VPGASTSFRITMLACPYADDAATRLTASMTKKIESFLRTFLFTSLRVGLGCGTVALNQLRIDSKESPCRARIVDAGLCNSAILVHTSHSYTLKTTLEVYRV